jgi:hypothetical protein
VVLLAVAAVILIGVIAVAVGRGGELDPAEADYRPVDLDDVTSTDVALMRPPTALFGYQREATDAALGQIARAISEREVEIATLRRQLAEQLPVRTSPVQRADTMRPEPPSEPGFGTGPRPDTRPGTGPLTKEGLPARPHTRPPARLPAEPPAPPAAASLWQTPPHPQAPASPLPSRPVSSWPPKAPARSGSLFPEPMPNSSMPHIPLTGQAQTQAQPSGPAGPAGGPGASLPSRPAPPPGRLPSRPAAPAPAGPQPPPGPSAGTYGPDQEPIPARPSVLHRELADRPGDQEPGAEADPWLVWQRRTEQPAAQDAPPPAAGAHPADAASDPGEQR